MGIQLADMTVIVNNDSVGIVPNSLKFTEGFGEQQVRAESTGGGEAEQVFSDDIETKIGKVMFDMMSTPENIELVREWKAKKNTNTVQLTGSTSDGKKVTRSYTQMAILGDYEVEIGTEGNTPVEMSGNAPI